MLIINWINFKVSNEQTNPPKFNGKKHNNKKRGNNKNTNTNIETIENMQQQTVAVNQETSQKIEVTTERLTKRSNSVSFISQFIYMN
jgi:hypothetical protein